MKCVRFWLLVNFVAGIRTTNAHQKIVFRGKKCRYLPFALASILTAY